MGRSPASPTGARVGRGDHRLVDQGPPAGAVVLSVDEKTQVQALDRTQPLLPIAFDATEKRTHDYVRHGTTTSPRSVLPGSTRSKPGSASSPGSPFAAARSVR